MQDRHLKSDDSERCDCHYYFPREEPNPAVQAEDCSQSGSLAPQKEITERALRFTQRMIDFAEDKVKAWLVQRSFTFTARSVVQVLKVPRP